MESQDNQIVLFQSQDGRVRLEVNSDEQTVWLRQEQIAELFDKERTNIGRHIAKIFGEGELDEKSNVQKMHFPFSDKPVKFCSLDVVLAVGYGESRGRIPQMAGKYIISGRESLFGDC